MTDHVRPRAAAELAAGLDSVRKSPADRGTVEMIVRRPAAGEREVVERADIDLTLGLVGDNWKQRGSRHMTDGSADPDAQVTLMNARAIALLARTKEHWPLAGDQLYVDLDLSVGNLPAGTRLQIGSAVLLITAQPHTGCKQFAARFGAGGRAVRQLARGRATTAARHQRPGARAGRGVTMGDIVAKA